MEDTIKQNKTNKFKNCKLCQLEKIKILIKYQINAMVLGSEKTELETVIFKNTSGSKLRNKISYLLTIKLTSKHAPDQ